VEHARLAAGLHAWIGRHPDDGRYVLNNGYDWSYFTVDDAPFQVRAVRAEPERVVLLLSDGSEEAWAPEGTRVGEDGALYAAVKAQVKGGPFEARFSRHAQTSLAAMLVEDASSPSGVAVPIHGRLHAIGAKNAGFG
jgi:hypothetical protein